MSSRRRDVKGTSRGGGRRQGEKRRRAAWDSLTLLPTPPKSNRQTAKGCRKAGTEATLLPSNRNETAKHRAGIGHWVARGWARSRAAHGGQCPEGSKPACRQPDGGAECC